MSFNSEEGAVKFKKLKVFLILSLFLLFIILIDFFIRSTMNVSNFYDFKSFENKSGYKNINLSKNVFVSNKVLNLNFGESCYSLLSDNLISYSDYYYVLLNSSQDYSVFSVKNNKFLFKLKFKDFVFVINNLIFTLNNLYKTLEIYDSGGNNILVLNFLSSILSVDYNNEVLVLGLSNGEVNIYKQGKIIYTENFLERKFPAWFVKLSFDNKYLVSIKGNSKYFLEIIDLENNYKKILELSDLAINSFETFIKIDDYHNLFIESENSLVVINIKSVRIFKVENKNSILRASYDYFQNIYRIYFYSESEKIINIKTYSANSFRLFDNIFIKDEISSFVEFGNGILYFNTNNDLKYLGLGQ
ncbi:hypothetical protein [Borreliella valaisiana]|uniref:hypothetical protein n=1 Tax=Borreliella valaisiana TaxID=62088 RepID=UPI0004E7C9AB|nr:hypothetical protein [Borreliella valaisiana]AIJ29677.1 hypothetical protein P613_01570 [Borreliella valaisiana Tom4006]WKC76956.1 hypothetical protein QIA32_02075 [Borreliella valaisiana]WLN25118.1 hypothetical protein KJD10_01530 [Borreliella valaisiana]WVN14044.1 hypothetical protein KJD09_01550 [Borreliella valaisiana]